MSMLAESRRKQRVSLNPRGKWWTEDPNKFGQKMLEKMGWTKGKGLGANEQGMAEYSIKSVQKTCASGIGYDENFEKWTENHEKFNGILEQLQENQDIIEKKNKDDCSNKQSIELKSKESRARVHYQKFTRSKDINKYKLKDLANIFGQEELSSKIQTKIKKEINDEKEVTENRDNWHGVVTINGGNMADYFKFKSNNKNKTHLKCKPNNITDNQAIDSESENEQHIGFGFVSDKQINTENTLSSNYVDDNEISKDSSKKSNYAFDNPCLRLNSAMETTSTDDSPKKSLKKKKKKGLEINNLNINEINSSCSDFSSNHGISKNSNEKSNATSTGGSPKKSLKKRKKELETDNLYTDETEHDTRKKLKTIDSNCNGFPSNYGILKDSNEKSNAFDNPCLKLNSSVETASTNDSSEKSSKKKKELETNNSYTNETNKHDTGKKLKTKPIDSNCSDFSSNGTSKDSNENSNYAFDNPCLRLNDLTEDTNIDDSSKKSLKKKKKNKKKELEINNLNTDEINETIDNNLNDFLSSHGMSKDPNENSNYAFDNPCLRLNNLMENTNIADSSKKSLKKKKKKKELEINNLNTDEINETIDNSSNDFSSNRTSKDSNENSNYAFDNPCLRLNSPVETISIDSSKKSLKKKKKKKEFEINNLNTDEINEYETRKRKIETIDSNCSDFSSNCEISKDSGENSNYAFDNPCLKLNSPMESTDDSSTKSLKKKKKKKKELETNNSWTEINKYDTGKKLETIDSNCSGFTNPALDLNSDPKEDCNGKEFEISRAQFGLENCALDLTDETCDKKRVTFNDQIMLYEYDKNSIKKKKGKHTLDKFEVENKKHKKKQKCESVPSSTYQEDTERLAKKDKKHKKSKNKNALNDENCFDTSMEITVNNTQQEKVEKVKLTDIFPESCEVISVSNQSQSVGITDSPSNAKVRMSKKMLITLFHKNAISDFPGSNIHDIKGYGVDEC